MDRISTLLASIYCTVFILTTGYDVEYNHSSVKIRGKLQTRTTVKSRDMPFLEKRNTKFYSTPSTRSLCLSLSRALNYSVAVSNHPSARLI